MAESLLSAGPLPSPALVAYVVAHGGDAERAAIAGNGAVSADELMAVAERADERVARRLMLNPSASREVMMRVLEHVPIGTLLPVKAGGRNVEVRRMLPLAAVSEDPELLSWVLEFTSDLDQVIGDTVVLQACLGLLRVSGPEAVAAAMAERKPRFPRAEDDPVRAAYENPVDAGLLARALEYEGRTPVVAERINACEFVDDAASLLYSPRAPLDWAYLLDRRDTFRREARAALACQVGCPEELRPAPPSVPRRVRRVRDSEVFMNGHARRRMTAHLADLEAPTQLVLDAYASGQLSAATILRRGAPARNALEIFGHRDEPERRLDALRALAAATAGLGAEPDGWVVALNLLPTFPGTCGELVATAKAVVS